MYFILFSEKSKSKNINNKKPIDLNSDYHNVLSLLYMSYPPTNPPPTPGVRQKFYPNGIKNANKI